MTSLVHLVCDDWVEGQRWDSRSDLALYYVLDNFLPGDNEVAVKGDSPFFADGAHSALRQYVQFGGTEAGIRFNNQGSAGVSLMPASGRARTYELIAKVPLDALNFDLSVEDPDDNSNFLLRVDATAGGLLTFQANTEVETVAASAAYAPAADEQWHFWTCVFDVSVPAFPTVKIYDGGVLVLSEILTMTIAEYTTPSSTNPFQLLVGDNSAYFLELFVHDRALTEDEILARTFHFRSLRVGA